jgi:hypothetical protein
MGLLLANPRLAAAPPDHLRHGTILTDAKHIDPLGVMRTQLRPELLHERYQATVDQTSVDRSGC